MSLDAQLAVQLCASVDGLTRAMGERQRALADLAEAIFNPETRSISFLGSDITGGFGVAPTWGPPLGWSWYVQMVTVGPLASGDTLAIYRGRSKSDNQDQRLKNQFLGTNGTWQVWHPGRTGFALAGNKDGLVFDAGSGSLTSATRYFVNVDVIAVTDRYRAQFLM